MKVKLIFKKINFNFTDGKLAAETKNKVKPLSNMAKKLLKLNDEKAKQDEKPRMKEIEKKKNKMEMQNKKEKEERMKKEEDEKKAKLEEEKRSGNGKNLNNWKEFDKELEEKYGRIMKKNEGGKKKKEKLEEKIEEKEESLSEIMEQNYFEKFVNLKCIN